SQRSRAACRPSIQSWPAITGPFSRRLAWFSRVSLDGEKLPVSLFISGTALYKEGEAVLDFDYDLNGESHPIEFADGVVTVPLEFIDEENHDYQIAMGELVALKPLGQKTDCLPSDWPSRLAALLIP
ncbi:MAG: hypothetical protein RLZZ516_1629, partial [Cyanobacteriota bacterium]